MPEGTCKNHAKRAPSHRPTVEGATVMSFAGVGGFSTPINILGFPGFQGQISYGGGAFGTGNWLGEPGYGWSPPRWIVDLSLGEGWFGRLPNITSMPGVPALVSEANRVTEDAFPLQIDLRDPTPNEIELLPVEASPVPLTTTDPGYYEEFLRLMGYPPWGPGLEPIAVVEPPVAEILTGDDDMGWISDVYDIIDTAAGGLLPGGVPIGTSIPGQIFSTAPLPTVVSPVSTIPPPIPPPGGAVMATGCDDDPMRGYVYKKVCGSYRWVKPKKRRRGALVTKTDLRGLAALKGVLGGGKAFETWIATHS